MGRGWSAIVAAATRRLDAAGVASPRVDAELLAAHVAGVERGRLIVAEPPGPEQIDEYESVVARRERREPLQHILGIVAFRRVELAVGPGVFVPRPETELVVEALLAGVSDVPDPVIVDLCSGTGAIALSIATERPDATVFAVERDPGAWHWMTRNLAGSSVRAVDADAVDPTTLSEWDGRCAAVISNPPYVPSSVAVSTEVETDPAIAVFGGDDGLSVIRPLVDRIFALLAPGGVTAIEHDDTHEVVVPDLLRAKGFTQVRPHRDLAGKPRFTMAVKPT